MDPGSRLAWVVALSPEKPPCAILGASPRRPGGEGEIRRPLRRLVAAMASTDKMVRIYQELADYYDSHNQAPVRDRMLVLAADAALSAGRTEEAERMRARLLQLNPPHLLKPFASFPEAAKSPDVRSYLAGLRRTYPPETATQLLESLRS